MIPSKSMGIFYCAYPLNESKLIIVEPSRKLHLLIYKSQYSNLKFAGKLIWYAADKFVATCIDDD